MKMFDIFKSIKRQSNEMRKIWEVLDVREFSEMSYFSFYLTTAWKSFADIQTEMIA